MTAILEERNNRMIFLWEINFTFMQIFNNYWTRLSKISCLICETLTNHDIFAIIEFNNCFIIQSPCLFFIIGFSDSSGKRSAIFTQEHGFNYA